MKNEKTVGANAYSLCTTPGVFPYLTGKFPESFHKLGADSWITGRQREEGTSSSYSLFKPLTVA